MSDGEITLKVVVQDDGTAKYFNSLGEEIALTGQKAERATEGFSRTEAKLVTVASAASLAHQVFNLLGRAADVTIEALNRGAEVDDISVSFENLATKAGAVSSVLLENLNRATGETISNFDLMKQSNELLLGGIKPDKIVEMAEAARALGEQTGVNAKEGMDALTTSILKGNARAVESLGIIIDDNKALAEFAAKNGIAADQVKNLSEEAKKLAIREAVFKALAEQSANFGEVTKDAGDQVVRAGKLMVDKFDQVYRAVAGDAGVNEALKQLIESIKGVNAQQFAETLSTIAREFILLTEAAVKFAIEGLGLVKETIDSISGNDGAFNAGINAIQKLLGGNASVQADLAALGSRAKEVSDILKSDLPNAAEVARAKFAELKKDITDKQLFDVAAVQKALPVLAKLGEVVKSTGIDIDGLLKSHDAAAGAVKKHGAATAGTTKDLIDHTKAAEDAKKHTEDLRKAQEAITKATDQFSVSLNKLLGRGGLPEAANALDELAFGFVTGAKTAAETEAAVKKLLQQFSGSPEQVKAFEDAVSDSFKNIKDEIEEADKAAAEFFENMEAEARQAGEEIGGAISSGLGNILKGDLEGGLGSIFSQLGQIGGKKLGESLGASLGGAFGAGLGGPIGATLGGFLGESLVDGIAGMFHHEDAGTTARKAADKFFADAFDANRLSVIINGQLTQISDLVFKGETLFGGNSQFEGGGFADFLLTLPATVQQAFLGVGTAFEELLGVSDDISGQIGAVLANNIGGSLNNLQLLVEASGKSFEELHTGIVDAFLDGKLSALQAQSAMQGLAQVAQKGIPDAIGATTQAFANLKAAGASGGRAVIDALKDIGFEAKELGINTLPALQAQLAASGQFTAEEIQSVFDALAASGIDSIEELTNATNEQLIAALAQLEATEFPFAAAADDVSGLADTLERLPSEKTLTFNIKTNFDANTQTAIKNGQVPINASSVQVSGAPPGLPQ